MAAVMIGVDPHKGSHTAVVIGPAVAAMAGKLGLADLLGPACAERDLAMALVVSRVVRPGTKLSTLTWWAETTLGADLGAAETSADAAYGAMDWLAARQDQIGAKLAARYLGEGANPSRWRCSASRRRGWKARIARWPPAAIPWDGKKGRRHIEYGLLTDPDGLPVAVRVFPGDTGDPAAFTEIVQVVRGTFKLDRMVMVVDRGMITKARTGALNTAADGTKLAGGDAYGWITALRVPAIKG